MMTTTNKKITLNLSLKSPAMGVFLSLIFGPVGLLYATPWGGSLMIVIAILLVRPAYPFLTLVIWMVCCIWSAFAIDRYNKKMLVEFREVTKQKKDS